MVRASAAQTSLSVVFCHLGLPAAHAVQPMHCSVMCKNAVRAMKMWSNLCCKHFMWTVVSSLCSLRIKPDSSLIRWELFLPVEALMWDSGPATCPRLSPIFLLKPNQQDVSYGWLQIRPTHWCCRPDTLGYKHQTIPVTEPTMRYVYRVLASQYDPLGYILPYTTRAKVRGGESSLPRHTLRNKGIYICSGASLTGIWLAVRSRSVHLVWLLWINETKWVRTESVPVWGDPDTRGQLSGFGICGCSRV